MTSIRNAVDREEHQRPRRLQIASSPADAPKVDVAAAERAAGDLLVALGADLELEGLRETPRRMAAAYGELLTPEQFSLTTFPNEEGYDELVLVRDIPFQSLCMHHLLPFTGSRLGGWQLRDRACRRDCPRSRQVLGRSRWA